jgi:hypothetical protein
MACFLKEYIIYGGHDIKGERVARKNTCFIESSGVRTDE